MLTTLDIGEESVELSAPITTMATGEEDQPPTTMATGEEDGPKTLNADILNPFGAF